jgi:hypothetical protein
MTRSRTTASRASAWKRRTALSGSIELAVAFAVALTFGVMASRAHCAEAQDAQTARMRAVMRTLPDGVYPLYVLGDVNEDGKVDRNDLGILTKLVAALEKHAPLPAAATCIAAADIDRNGDIDARDVRGLQNWLKDTPALPGPALYWQPGLPCSYMHLMVASKAQAHPGETIPVILLGDGLAANNTQLMVESGPATAERASDGHSFAVKVASSAGEKDHIVLRILAPPAREYFYTITVVIPPSPGGPPMPAGISR